MIANFNILLLAGGRARCTPAWDKPADAIDACFKIYFVTGGSAELVSQAGRHPLRAGRIYLIDGHRLVAQRCPRRMDVAWVHFAPESLVLHRVLSALPPVTDATAESAPQADEWRALHRIFEEPGSGTNRPVEGAPLAALCRVQGLFLHLIGHVLERHRPAAERAAWGGAGRFQRVIGLMDARFRDNPPLAELAATAGMAPAHFHRRFRSTFGLTPHDYMLRRRMDLARHLLGDPSLRVQEVAEAVGYGNPFYFARVFRRQMGFSPSELRRREGTGMRRRF